MITKPSLFRKNFDEVTDEEWQDLYEYRSSRGVYYSPCIHDGQTLKASVENSRNQAKAVKEYLEKTTGYEVDYLDPTYDYIFCTTSPVRCLPDLVVHDTENGDYTVDVKNRNYKAGYDEKQYKALKLLFRLRYGETTTPENVLARVWASDFHDADMVAFIRPDCKELCIAGRDDISLDKNHQPTYGQYGDIPVSFFLKHSEWIDLTEGH